MKITLLALAVILLSASTYAQSSSHDSATETSDPKSSESSVATSPSPTETPPTSSTSPTTTSSSSSSAAPTTPPSSSSAPTTTQSSSSAPTTTSSTSSQPTIATSTTSEPTTTSSTPSTTPIPESTTSVKPPTSTESPTTPTSSPIPVPEPGYWNVTEGNTTCIRANMAIRFKIELNGDVNYILLSPTASSDGSRCNTSDGTERLMLKDNEYNVIFTFEKKADNVYVKNVSFTYYLPMSTETFTNDSHLFDVKAGSSYLCRTSSDVILGNATMEIISVHIQAFGAEHNKDFAGAEECGADNPINDIVPIAVGVALLALVVVVLIAYLVGRRRSRQKGYQSV